MFKVTVKDEPTDDTHCAYPPLPPLDSFGPLYSSLSPLASISSSWQDSGNGQQAGGWIWYSPEGQILYDDYFSYTQESELSTPQLLPLEIERPTTLTSGLGPYPDNQTTALTPPSLDAAELELFDEFIDVSKCHGWTTTPVLSCVGQPKDEEDEGASGIRVKQEDLELPLVWPTDLDWSRNDLSEKMKTEFEDKGWADPPTAEPDMSSHVPKTNVEENRETECCGKLSRSRSNSSSSPSSSSGSSSSWSTSSSLVSHKVKREQEPDLKAEAEDDLLVGPTSTKDAPTSGLGRPSWRVLRLPVSAETQPAGTPFEVGRRNSRGKVVLKLRKYDPSLSTSEARREVAPVRIVDCHNEGEIALAPTVHSSLGLNRDTLLDLIARNPKRATRKDLRGLVQVETDAASSGNINGEKKRKRKSARLVDYEEQEAGSEQEGADSTAPDKRRRTGKLARADASSAGAGGKITGRKKQEPKRAVCTICSTSFTRKQDLRRHTKTKHERAKHKCTHCGRAFTRADSVRRHWNMTPCDELKEVRAEEIRRDAVDLPLKTVVGGLKSHR